MSFKKVLIGLFSAATAFSLVGCADKQEEEKELVVWAWNKNVLAMNEGIKAYQKEVNPNFKARVESFARMDIDKKFKTASQTENYSSIADVVLCDAMNILTYNDLWSNIFVDFNKEITKEEKNNLVKSTVDIATDGNRLIGLPFGIGPTVVFANKNLWDEAKLNDVIENGWTWEDYKSIGLEIKKSHSDAYMTAYNMRNDDRIYRTMTSQRGEWFMDREYNVVLGNETSLAAMNMVKDMYDNGVVGHIDTGDYKSLMKNNKIAAQIQGFFLGGQLKDVAPEMSGDWRVLPLPKWNKDDSTSASITGGSYLYANNSLKGKNRENAIDFVKFMTLRSESPIRTLKVAGIYPALKTAYETDYFKNTKDEYFGNVAVQKNVADFSLDAKAIIATKYNGFNYDAFIKSQEKILFNAKDVKAELEACAKLMKDNAK